MLTLRIRLSDNQTRKQLIQERLSTGVLVNNRPVKLHTAQTLIRPTSLRPNKQHCAANSRVQASEVFGRYLLEECAMPGPLSKMPLLKYDPHDDEASEVTVDWDKTAKPMCPRRITHKETGSTVLFVWSQASGSDTRLRGVQFDWAIIDEDAGTQAFLDELFPRLIVAQSDPERKHAGWLLWSVTQTVANMAMEQFIRKCTDSSLPDYRIFIIKPEDSKAVSVEARKRMSSGLSDKARQIRMEGTGSALSNVLIYPCLTSNQERYVRPEPYEPTDRDNIFVAYDPGVDHPSGILFAMVNEHEPMTLNIVHFICQSQMSLSYEVELIRDWLNGRKMTMFIPDPFGGGRSEKGTGKSVNRQLFDMMDDSELWQSSNGRPLFGKPKGQHYVGISTVREYLEPPSDVWPTPLIRIDPPTPDNGLGMFLAQMQMYRGREDLDFQGPSGVIKKNDEACDTLRYLCLMRPVWRDNGENKPSRPYKRRPILTKEDRQGR
jgi:hypothetical protein